MGRCTLNTKESSPEAEVIKTRLFVNSDDFRKVKIMKTPYTLQFKILIGCLIPIEGSTNQISLDHSHFIWYLVKKAKINLPGYIFHHMCEAIKDSKKHTNKNVPYVRLLSELFHQGRLIYSLRDASAHDDLEEIHGNILSTSILANMKLLKRNAMVILEEPLRARSTKSSYLEDYLVITKHDNPEVIREFIKMARKEVGVVLTYEELP